MNEKQIEITENAPASPKRKANRTRTSNAPLTAEEVEKLLANIDVLEDRMLISFGVYSGVRVGEVPSLDYARINMQEQSVTIWDEKKDKDRTIYLPQALITLLVSYWKDRVSKNNPKFFAMSTKSIERRVQYWTEKVLAKRKSWHCLRHTYITLSSERKVPIEIVISNTGDRASTILQYYSHPSPAFIRKEIEEKKLFKLI
jgi:integrase